MRIGNRPPNIMRTFPRAFDWQAWVDYVERAWVDKGSIIYFGRALPRDVQPGAWLYIVWQGQVRAAHEVRDVMRLKHAASMETWTGDLMQTQGYIECTGPLIEAPFVIHWQGFQGYRYVKALW